ncbi:hypothetical protein AAKU52_000131 [Pedobacter sp. CG_S7]|uniref:hypothetical protein n=1 Tax=Pedobacter sp. CG_S7 TaxID=3143930 RepID=UPI003390E0B9
MNKVLVFLAFWLLTINTQAQFAVEVIEKNNKEQERPVPITTAKLTAVKDWESLANNYKVAFEDPNVKNYFSMSISAKPKLGISSSKVISQHTYHIFEIGVKINTVISHLLHCKENQIELPKDLKTKVIAYCFKQDGLLNKEHGEKFLLKNLLENLKLKTVLSNAIQVVAQITVIDTLKLNLVKVKQNDPFYSGIVQTEGANVITIKNGTLNTLSEQLERALALKVEFNYKSLFADYFNFSLKNDSFETLQQSLLTYGLSLKKVQKNLQKYSFE